MVKTKIVRLGNCDLFYLDAFMGSNTTAILMHGYNWTSDVWIESETIKSLNDNGINVYAIDIPGFPKSRSKFDKTDVTEEDIIDILLDFARKNINPETNLFLLGTSGSGYVALKIAEKHSYNFKGIIAVAPVEVNKINLDRITSRLLVIYGTEDTVIKDVYSEAGQFNGDVSIKIIKNAGHRCYIDKPMEFNHILLDFINSCVN